jgi:hypothetical protein
METIVFLLSFNYSSARVVFSVENSWLKTGDGWGDYEFKDCTMGNGSIFSATAFGL